MLDWPLVCVYGGLCAAAIVFAAHVPRGRIAVILAGSLMVNWALFILSYTPYRIVPVAFVPDQWAVVDGICGALALLAFNRWWGWALWLCAMAQESIHFGYTAGVFSDLVYTDMLDRMLLAQLAIFFLIGGAGVFDNLHRGIARLRFRRWSASASRTDARE